MKYIYKIIVVNVALLLLFSCDPQEDDSIGMDSLPTADEMSFSFTEGENNVFAFENTSSVTGYAYWDFGDGSEGTGDSDTTIYTEAGDYVVTMTLITNGGSGETIDTITVASDYEYDNIVVNGEFDDGDDSWTTYQVGSNVVISIADGAATWTGGSWDQAVMYQAIEVEAGEYQVDMNISGSGTTDSWFEVYFSTTAPTEGSDYTDGDVLLGLNTWTGCGGDEFDGDFTNITCSDETGGLVEFSTAGTAYLVIKGGGSDLGTTGITVDDIVVYSTEP
jgi:hypothetical protein